MQCDVMGGLVTKQKPWVLVQLQIWLVIIPSQTCFFQLWNKGDGLGGLQLNIFSSFSFLKVDDLLEKKKKIKVYDN